MSNQKTSLDQAWSVLHEHRQHIGDQHLRDLFEQDPQRFETFSREACGLFMDFSKQRINSDTLENLRQLLDAADLKSAIQAMFSGQRINDTEQRAVLHTALRAEPGQSIVVDGENVVPKVHEVLSRMQAFTEKVRSGEWKGHTGKPIRHIVNIGIGGSDLGPAMVSTALRPYHQAGLKAWFVSNIDFSHLYETLQEVDAETTLFVIESKTFTTQETLTNAHSARAWFLQTTGADESAIARHFVAVSTNAEGVSAFGIDTDNMFGFWDWVGGRYSLWSAVGLPIALVAGMSAFRELLAGAHAMDEHFQHTDWTDNLPVIMGLLGIWNTNLLEAPSLAVLPYDYCLRRLPDYLQQLEMESTGKHTDRQGRDVDHHTCPVIWGAAGNNGQHAFYQLLHQGTRLVPSDFIVPLENAWQQNQQHALVFANAFGQTEALMKGRTAEEVAGMQAAEFRTMKGNQPSTTITYQRLTPAILGALIALYEHKVFVQSVCWNINAFDQWGVELGKQLARAIEPELVASEPATAHDASTCGLINRARDAIKGYR